MRSSTAEAVLERRETGERCEAIGCYGLAVWSISSRDETSHLCSKHTRMKMREQSSWDVTPSAEIEP